MYIIYRLRNLHLVAQHLIGCVQEYDGEEGESSQSGKVGQLLIQSWPTRAEGCYLGSHRALRAPLAATMYTRRLSNA